MTATGNLTRRGLLTGMSGRRGSSDRAKPGAVAGIGGDCLARAGIHCRSCGDACPEAAIRFRPRLGAPPLPEVGPARCTGCGACVEVCPAGAVSLGAGDLGAGDLGDA